MQKPKGPHLDPLALARLLRREGQLEADQLHHFVSHLVAGCRVCIETLRQLTEIEPLENEVERLDEDRATDLRFNAALDASGIFEDAEGSAIEESGRFADEQSRSKADPPSSRAASGTRASCELLLQQVRQKWSQDTDHALSLLHLALGIAAGLDEKRYGASHLADLEAKILAYFGNVHRINDDLTRADRWFARALDRLQKGSSDPLIYASVHELLASLRRDQQRFGQSDAIFEDVATRYLEAGNRHDAGRALINQATVAQELGETAKALGLLRKAKELLSFELEPRLELVVLHNTLSLLAESPEGAIEARRLLEENRSLYETQGDVVFDSRLPWVEGRIAMALNELDQAEASLRLAQRNLLASNNPLIWALASLDLAVILARQMRFAELEELAQNILETFMSRGLQQSTFATLLLLVKNAQAKQVTVEMLRSTAVALRRAPKPGNAPPT